MAHYEAKYMQPHEEPQVPFPSELGSTYTVPTETEIRYLGNRYNYCNYFHAELKDCVEGGVKDGDTLLFKRCK